MKNFILFFLLLLVSDIFGQYNLEGTVKQVNKESLAFASIVLKSTATGQFVAGNISSEDGHFIFSKILPGNYSLEVSMLGFESKSIDRIEITGMNRVLDDILLSETTQNIEEVQISARKVMYEKKIDRLMVNVQNSAIAAGSSALDIIERSPGMVVNRQAGSISMAGRDGVVVMINGKRQYIQEEALTGLLSGMNANSIAKLEIISTPPSSFDAEGNAGFINIVLIKSANDGLNVNYGATVGGYKGFIGNSNATIAYNKGRWSSFMDVSGSTNHQSQDFRFTKITNTNSIATNTRTVNERFPIRNIGTLRLGTTYSLGKSSFSLASNGYLNNWKLHSDGTATITKNNIYNNTIISTQDETNNWKHSGISLGYSHAFDNKSTLTVNSDYLHYYTENPTTYTNKYILPISENPISENSKSFKSTPIQLLVNAIDYEYKVGKFNLESGAKHSLSKFTNDASVEYLVNNVWTRQEKFSNYAKMNESIVAAYTSVDGKIGDETSFKAGLRFEKSLTIIKNEKDSTIINRDLPYFFPSLFINRSLSQNSSLSLSFSRRITRPSFNDLAPFIFFTDPTSLVTGNPALLSELSQSLNAEFKLNSKVISLQYAIDKNPISRFVPEVDGNSSRTIARVRNFDRFTTLSASVSLPYSIQKWWDVNINLTGYAQKIFGKYETSEINIKRLSANAFVSNSLSLPKSFKLEIGGLYNTGGFFGPFKNQPFGSLNLALLKKVKNSSFSIGVDNALNTMRFKTSFMDPATNNEFSNDMIFNRANVKFVFRNSFGNNNAKSQFNNNSSEEERKRVD